MNVVPPKKKTILVAIIVIMGVVGVVVYKYQYVCFRKSSTMSQQEFNQLESSILAYLEADNFEQAWRMGDKHINSHSLKQASREYYELCFITGFACSQAGKFDKANIFFEEHAKALPTMPDHQRARYYLHKGRLFYKQGCLKEATDSLLKAVEINDDFFIKDAYTTLGLVYLDLNKNDEALSVLRQNIKFTTKKYGKNSEEEAESYFWLARAYLLMEKLDQAKKNFNRSIAVLNNRQPEFPIAVMAYLNLAGIAEIYDKDKALALKFLRKAHEANKQLPRPIKESQQPIQAKIEKIKLELK